MRTWSRQPATLSVSPSGKSSVVSAIADELFALLRTNPAASAQAVQRREPLLGLVEGVLDPPGELGKARLQIGALRLSFADRGLCPLANVALGLGEALLQRLQEFLALSLHVRRDGRHARVEPPGSRVAELREPLGQGRLRVAREHLHGAVELARE